MTPSSLGKVFEKQTKNRKKTEQRKYQVLEVLHLEKNQKQKSIEGLFSK